MRWACVLLLSLTVALVPPAARLPSHVVCGGAAYDYCIQALGCTAEEAAKAERALLPNIAESITRAQAEERCSWLRSRLDLSDAELKKVVLWSPTFLSKSVEDTLAPKLEWLQTRLDLDAAELRKVVMGRPSQLSYSVEDNMAPRLEWLQTRLDLDDSGLRKMILEFPALLGCSLEDNIAPKLDWMQHEIGLSRPELRDRVLGTPAIMSLSLDKRYRPRLEACRAAGVDAEYVLTYVSKTDEKFYELLEEKSLRDAS